MTRRWMLIGVIVAAGAAGARAEDPPWQCPAQGAICPVTDTQGGIGFDLPPGWAADPVGFFNVDTGAVGTLPITVFFPLDDGPAAWFLNPAAWEPETGPCRPVATGRLCAVDNGVIDEGAFAIIAPSLRALADPSP